MSKNKKDLKKLSSFNNLIKMDYDDLLITRGGYSSGSTITPEIIISVMNELKGESLTKWLKANIFRYYPKSKDASSNETKIFMAIFDKASAVDLSFSAYLDTGTGNNLLHKVALAGDFYFAKKLIASQPSLLLQTNNDSYTPLDLADQGNKIKFINDIIKFVKTEKMPSMSKRDKVSFNTVFNGLKRNLQSSLSSSAQSKFGSSKAKQNPAIAEKAKEFLDVLTDTDNNLYKENRQFLQLCKINELRFSQNMPALSFLFDYLNFEHRDRLLDLVKRAAKLGYKFDTKDLAGNTLLHKAVLADDSEFIKIITKRNCKLVMEKNNEGKTPLDFAEIRMKQEPSTANIYTSLSKIPILSPFMDNHIKLAAEKALAFAKDNSTASAANAASSISIWNAYPLMTTAGVIFTVGCLGSALIYGLFSNSSKQSLDNN